MIHQITKTLPRSDWQKIRIRENHEPLVEVEETPRLKRGSIIKQYRPLFYVRETVREKLYRVSEILPPATSLVIIEGYRTLESQQEAWDKKFQKLRADNPRWTDEQIEQQVRLVLAKPAPLANHHCGGAIDVTLAYDDGTLVDMGSPYPHEAMSADWHNKFRMLSDDITDAQKTNRKILRGAMEIEDFVWYPGEWWHYCWGDRMWAVYSNSSECWYGPANLTRF